MSWFLKAVTNYAGFTGRSQRAEYWYFILFYMLIYMVAAIIDTTIGTQLISLAVSLALLLPSIAVTVRRLHDTDRSGWWILIGLVPIVGMIVILVFMVMDGTPGDNRFGPNPKVQSA